MQNVFNVIVQIIKVTAFYLAVHLPLLTSETASVLTIPKVGSGFIQMIEPPPSRPRRN